MIRLTCRQKKDSRMRGEKSSFLMEYIAVVEKKLNTIGLASSLMVA